MVCRRDEGEIKERRSVSAREGECRVLRVGQDAAATLGHHVTTGQGLHHQTDHFLPQDEERLPGR